MNEEEKILHERLKANVLFEMRSLYERTLHIQASCLSDKLVCCHDSTERLSLKLALEVIQAKLDLLNGLNI